MPPATACDGATLMAAAVKAPWAALAEVQHVFEQAVMEAATRLVSEGDDPVQLLIDVLLQTQQADAATEAPAEGGLTMVDVQEAAQKLGLAQMTRARLRHLFRFLGVQPTGAIKAKELQDGLDVLTELASSTAAHHEVDESKLPAGLQGFTPIAKQAEVQAQTKACAALEAAVSEVASSAAAKDKLRQHTHANLQPASLKAIDIQLQTEGILTICDQAIVAGVDCDHVYTSVFAMVKSGEAKGLEQLVTEVGAIEQARREGSCCVQQMTDPVALFADAARVRPMARAAMEAVAAQAKGARLEKQGPLKKMARILEKTSLRPGAGRGKAEKICDIVRDMKLATSMRAIAAMVRLLRESDAIEILRVKDRFTTPSAVRKTLLGLTSRCMILCACICASAEHSWLNMLHMSPSASHAGPGMFLRSRISSPRSPQSHSSTAMTSSLRSTNAAP